MSWANLLQQKPKKEKKAEEKTRYAKMSPGKVEANEYKIRILDEAPTQRYTHWVGTGKFGRTQTCLGKDKCPVCMANDMAKAEGKTAPFSARNVYGINIFNYQTQQYEILEKGITYFKPIAMLAQKLAKDGQNLTQRDISIEVLADTSNTGDNKNGGEKYTVMVYKEDKAEWEIDESKKYDLDKLFAPIEYDQMIRLMDGADPNDVFAEEAKTEAPKTPQPEAESVEVEVIDDADLPF